MRQRQPVREAVLEQRRHDHRDCRDTHGDRGGPADPAQEWRIEQLSLGLTGPGSNPCADGFDEAILNQANDERPVLVSGSGARPEIATVVTTSPRRFCSTAGARREVQKWRWAPMPTDSTLFT